MQSTSFSKDPPTHATTLKDPLVFIYMITTTCPLGHREENKISPEWVMPTVCIIICAILLIQEDA